MLKKNFPLIFPRRSLIRDELTDTFNIDINQLNIKVINNLATNILPLIQNYNYCAVTIDSTEQLNNEIKFVPFTNNFHTGHLLVWRKNAHYSSLVNMFINFIKTHLN